jgi:hypothetical protein
MAGPNHHGPCHGNSCGDDVKIVRFACSFAKRRARRVHVATRSRIQPP